METPGGGGWGKKANGSAETSAPVNQAPVIGGGSLFAYEQKQISC